METRINNDIVKQGSTLLNNSLTDLQSANLEGEKILDGKYSVFHRLNVVSGEADLYICTDSEGNRHVAKIYRRKDAVKQEVLETLMKLHFPYVADIRDIGEHRGCPLIILPYFKNGSLAGKTFDFGTMCNIIIPNVAKGIRYLHENGIMHKDIKPSNLMISDDGERILIIDFGISSKTGDGQSVLITRTGLSPEYSAPETFNNVFLNESDYYSFGITLYELFTGHTPFNNAGGVLSEDELAASASVQSIPFPESSAFPERLKNLIKGLTYKDLSHRNESDNPNRRWTWNEVEKWMSNESLQVPGEIEYSDRSKSSESAVARSTVVGSDISHDSDHAEFPQFYDFINSEGKIIHIKNIQDFVREFGTNWKEGKKHVGRGMISEFFREIKLRSVASLVLDCEEAGVTDEAYSKMLMSISAGEGESLFYWNSLKISTVKEISQYLNEALLEEKLGDTKLEDEYETVMRMLRNWYELNHKNEERKVIDTIQHIASLNGYDIKNKIINLNSFFNPDMRIKIDSRIFKNAGEFNDFASSLKKSNIPKYFKWIIDNQKDIDFYCQCIKSKSTHDVSGIIDDLKTERDRITQEQEKERIRKQKEQECIRREQEKERIRKQKEQEKQELARLEREVFFLKYRKGFVFEFGKYFFDNNKFKEPVKWRVLLREENRVLLITEDAVDFKPYSGDRTSGLWKDCSLRRWLNNDFIMSCFDANEQNLILKTKISQNPGETESDRVFLLNTEETDLFKDDSDRKCKATTYAKILDPMQDAVVFCKWWVKYGNLAATVDANGRLSHMFSPGIELFVRPAVWIDLDGLFKEHEKKKRIRKERDISLTKANVGSTVEFGEYPADNKNARKPVKWKVLSKENDRVLLITEDAIDCKSYHESYLGMVISLIWNQCVPKWKNCSLRSWLNNEFFNSCFDTKEQNQIINALVSNDYGDDTDDRVFLLSSGEAEQLFKNDEDRRCGVTPYAKNNGSLTDKNSFCWWWLRSRGSDERSAVYVDNDGRIFAKGASIFNNKSSVRPALWLDQKSIRSETEESDSLRLARIRQEYSVLEREEFLQRFQTGSIIEFGKYSIENEIGKEPVKWRVLAREGNTALLITEEPVGRRSYHDSYTSTTWESSSLRRWLNNEFFYSCFDLKEQGRIVNTTVLNDYGRGTEDKIFLLSTDEAERLFKDNHDRRCKDVYYSKNKNSGTDKDSFCWWWLRSRGFRDDFAAFVRKGGAIRSDGINVYPNTGYVRPVLWLKLE